MTQHRLQDQLAPPRTAGDGSTGWTAWVRGQWPAVRVVHLEAAHHLADVADRVRVRAVIHLGSLSPADVCVETMAAESTPGESTPGDAAERRAGELWSAQSYRNGTFVFEGFAASEAFDGEGRLSLRVRPRSAHAELSGLSVIARSSADRLESTPPPSLSDAEGAQPRPSAESRD